MSNSVEVLITLPFPDELIARLREVSPRLRIKTVKAGQATQVPNDEWQKVEILYTDKVLPGPEQAPNLKWVQFHWAGVDHIINHALLQKPGLVATTLSGAATPQMGEHVLMMLLALGHHLPELFSQQRKAEWPRERWKRFSPQELNSSVVGIVGYGSVGRQVARLLHSFGASVLATKRDVMRPEDTGYTPEGSGDPRGELVRRLYPPQALRSMFKECDFVVVTVPLTEETRDLIGAEELGALKATAFLVDISRGGVVNQSALIAALRDRKIAGAALDVFAEEPLASDSPLWKMPNVIITPHISGITKHYDERAVEMFAANLERYLAGEPLFNAVNPQRGY